MDIVEFDRQVGAIRERIGTLKQFFVCGAPKSGTTWLQKALDVHPEIVCAGEAHLGDRFLGDLFKLLERYFGHQKVVAQNVYDGHPHYRHNPNDTFRFVASAFALKVFAQLDIPAGTRFIGDKTPSNVEYLGILHRLFPEAKFIHIVRDGRDTLVSTFKHVERITRRDGRVVDLDRFYTEKTRTYAQRWVSAIETAERFSASHPGLLHTVRYEDMKASFGSAFSGVLEFLGASSERACVGACEAATSFKSLSGGREAGEENADAFYRKGVVGDWKTSLAPYHLDVFNEIGADVLVRYGYTCHPEEARVAGSD